MPEVAERALRDEELRECAQGVMSFEEQSLFERLLDPSDGNKRAAEFLAVTVYRHTKSGERPIAADQADQYYKYLHVTPDELKDMNELVNSRMNGSGLDFVDAAEIVWTDVH